MTAEPGYSAQTWLAAAIGGGLPEPTRHRWQPMRVGIVNLWEYDDAEFWFADGRLVLRGGNGAGKTKVLELTTLMLLRGEITPSVLDPFGSQHRTMRFNLLPTGEADDPRPPADSGLGYAWVEFGRLGETGQPAYFVCGMGASARRGSGTGGVTTWHFVTTHRPGKDFSLLAGGRAVEQKDLKKVDGVSVPPSAAAYRARLAAELFGLSEESYHNLTELLKQLRKPKLGERLNPANLAETLRDALPPLAANEITQLADGWEHLEQLRRAVEQTEQAATAVARFVRTGWQPWARVVVRRRADAFASATTDLDDTTREKRVAEKTLRDTEEAVRTAEGELSGTEQKKHDRDTALLELVDSPAYREAANAAVRVEALRRDIDGLERQLRSAHGRLDTANTSAGEARKQADTARRHAETAEEKVRGAGDDLLAAAEPAGLTESVQRHLPVRDIDSLTADYTLRAERFAELRGLHDKYTDAERRAERSALLVAKDERALRNAIDQEAEATGEVERSAETLRLEMRAWAASAEVARCSGEQVEGWCDAVAELTVIDPEQGTVLPGRSVAELMRAHVAVVRGELLRRQERFRLERAPLDKRRTEAEAELTDVRSRTERPPEPPSLWRRRARPEPAEGLGAPLWRCVNPVAAVDTERLALIEATLAASGLLDAWIFPGGDMSTVDGRSLADTQFRPVATGLATTETLLTVVEPSPAGGVSDDVVRRALSRVRWFDRAPAGTDDHGDWLAADGSWRLGGLAGRAEPARPASYLGATAREEARQREIRRLEAELDELATRLRRLDDELDRIARALAALQREEDTIPVTAERMLGIAVVTLAERARQRIRQADELQREQERHNANLIRRDTRWAKFAEYASAHRFGLRDLDGQSGVLQTFRSLLAKLTGELELLSVRGQALETAVGVCADREQAVIDARAEASTADGDLRQARVRLDTAEAALGADQRERLDQRKKLEDEIRLLAGHIKSLGTTLTNAKVAAGQAQEVLKKHEEQRARAERVRDDTMGALWATVDTGLAEPVGLPVPERRTVQTTREFAATVRREITAGSQDIDEDRAWRRCYERLEELRQKLLPNRDARVTEEETGAGIPRVTVLADPTSGWQAPGHAADALANRVREQQESYDTEQQRVLTTLLGSTFIEHLKDRLDYTAHTFKRINDQLAHHPTGHGHAVRMVWQADPTDPDTSAVVTALGRGYHQLGPERQDMVRSFLARKIDEARDDAAADGTDDWKDQLALALDYRRWLKLSLEYRPGAGSTWSVFDAARHAAKSGGEKVVLLSQPLFAAAVVAYNAATDTAPRWVWLDEAMTGVDATVKASFMGLTVDFELDVMLTAHDEWCRYATVPAVAVYDLSRGQHLPGVDAVPYLWCGGDLTRVEVDRLGFTANAPQHLTDGLFADLEHTDE